MDADSYMFDKFQDHFSRINQELERSFNSRISLIEDIGNHALLGAGKRLRPLLFVLSCQLCDYQGEDIYRLSTIFEYIHAASLLHDDVLDNAELRRRKPSANHLWGNHAAVLEGDFLYSKSFSIALGANSLAFLRRITETTTRMAEGQILELAHTNDWYVSKEDYMEIITSKTAVLISAACACGGIVSGAEENVVDCLGKFGLNLGIAFQLVDDLLDYTSSEHEFGKPVGKDLREGKVTLPLIYSLAGVGKAEIDRLQGLFRDHKAGEADYRRLISAVRNNGVVERIRSEAKVYADRAADFLHFFPVSSSREDLSALNQYIVKRRH